MANVGVTFDFAAESAKLRTEIDKVRKQLTGLKNSAESIDDNLKKFGATAKNVFGALGIATSIAGITSALFSAGKAAVEFGDTMQKAAAKTGIGAGQFALLADAAKMSDVDVGALSKSLQKMQVAISEAGSGGKSQLETFRALGIEFQELQRIAPEEQFLRIADQISKIQNPADKTRAAVELFGRAGADLLPFFEQGAAGIKKATDEIEKMGGKLTDEQIQKLAEVDDSVKQLRQSWSNFARTLVAEVAPAITEVLNRLAGATTSQVTAALAINLAKLEDLQKRREPYTLPGFDKRVLADLDAQIAETQKKVGDLRLQLASLNEAQSKGPTRRTQGPIAEAAPPPGFTTPAEEAKKAKDKASAVPDFSHGTLRTDRDSSLESLSGKVNDTLSDPRFLLEQTTQQALNDLAIQMGNERVAIIEETNNSILDSFLRTNDMMVYAEQAKNMTLGDSLGELAGMALQQTGVLGKIGKAYAIAQTVWSTGTAVMKAMAEVPWPANIAVAAAVAARGAMQLSMIKRTNIGSGGSVSSGGSIGATSVVNSAPQATQPEDTDKSVSQVVIHGNIFSSQETANWIIEQIRDAVNTRDVTFINSNSRQAMELAGA